MSRQIILKENNEIAVWSSVVDDFVFEGNIKEYIKIREKKAIKETNKNINKIYMQLKKGRTPYHNFQMTYEEACKLRDDIKIENSS